MKAPSMPARAIIARSKLPERSPENGIPLRSPPKRPGAIPTNITDAGAAPWPGTTRERHRTNAAHLRQSSIEARNASSAAGVESACGFDFRGAAAFEEQPRAMLDTVAFIFRDRPDLFNVGGDFREQHFDVNSAARGLESVERQHSLREQVDRGLASSAFQSQMKRRGDAV